MIRPDGSAELLDVPGGVPLGVGGVPFGTMKQELPPGSLLALYTDGLVESRSQSIDVALESMTRILQGTQQSLERTSDMLLGTLRPDPDDDVALLLVRTLGSTTRD
jgi:serine phosphatase RsbU (regulator of sigma subunit)